MTKIVKSIARFLSPLIMVFGAYIILHGHLSPGGGFAGGVILAAGFILLTLAFGKEVPLKIISNQAANYLKSLGALLFISLALLGYAGGYFFLNFLPKGEPGAFHSAGIIPYCDLGVGVMVGAALFSVFMAAIVLRIKPKE